MIGRGTTKPEIMKTTMPPERPTSIVVKMRDSDGNRTAIMGPRDMQLTIYVMETTTTIMEMRWNDMMMDDNIIAGI